MSIDIRELERLWDSLDHCDTGEEVCEAEESLHAYLGAHVPEILSALRDKERLDKLSRIRIVDGIGGLDIDEMTADAVSGEDVSEDQWAKEWAVQFRAAIDALEEE